MKSLLRIGLAGFVIVVLAAAGVQAAATSIQRPPTSGIGTAAEPPGFSAPQPTLLVAAPGEVEISILIQPTEHSRELRIFADSGSYYRSTTIGLRGVDSEPLHSFVRRGFPAGDYEVVGVLLDDRGQEEVVVEAATRVIIR